jgi:DNA-binding PadR family transcriptional regulator
MTYQILLVLGRFESLQTTLAGSEIAMATRMLSGTLYPILARLERAGWLKSEWEAVEPKTVGRPRRRLYRLTPLGYNKAREALRMLDPANGEVAWN